MRRALETTARTTPLYARGFIVAMGREFYYAIASDQEVVPMGAECEELCYFFPHRKPLWNS